MKISTPVIFRNGILVAAALAFAAPAFAKTSLNKAEQLCKAAVAGQTPAPKGFRVDKNETHSSDASVSFRFLVSHTDGTSGRLACTVDRSSATVQLAASE